MRQSKLELRDISDRLSDIEEIIKKAKTMSDAISSEHFGYNYSAKKKKDFNTEIKILWDYDVYSTYADIACDYLYNAMQDIKKLSAEIEAVRA